MQTVLNPKGVQEKQHPQSAASSLEVSLAQEDSGMEWAALKVSNSQHLVYLVDPVAQIMATNQSSHVSCAL